MSKSVYHIDLLDNSESYYFLPKPQYDDVLYYLTSMAHEYTEKSYYVERFDTDCYMLNYVLHGKGRFIYDGVSHALEEGTLTFAYLGVHNVLFPLSDDFEFCCFHLNGAQIKNVYKRITNSGKKITMKYPPGTVLSLFETLKAQLGDLPDFFTISKELGNFVTDLLCFTVGQSEIMSPMAHEVYKQIISNNMSVKQIADKLKYNPVYLERQFKNETGQSIRSLIVKHKLEQAENLLITTSMSINDIAKRLGYADTVGLIRLFKKYYDVTPLEFRNEKR